MCLDLFGRTGAGAESLGYGVVCINEEFGNVIEKVECSGYDR